MGSSASQTGGTASVDTAAVARSVWDNDIITKANRRIGWADTADVVNTIPGSGDGTEPETLIVLNTADSTAIEGASVVIRTLNQTTVKVDGLETDVNARLILELDVASYFAALTANNYTQLLDTLVVASGGGTDTLWMTEFDPGTPTVAGTGILYDWIYDINGNPDSGIVVSAEIPEGFKNVRYGSVNISRLSRSDTTGANGYWSLELYQYDSLTVNGAMDTTVYYIITGSKESLGEMEGGNIFTIEYKMPAAVSQQLNPGGGYDVTGDDD
jgi:hypothetical protein